MFVSTQSYRSDPVSELGRNLLWARVRRSRAAGVTSVLPLRIGHMKDVIGRRADGLREIDLFLGDWRSLSWVRNVSEMRTQAARERLEPSLSPGRHSSPLACPEGVLRGAHSDGGKQTRCGRSSDTGRALGPGVDAEGRCCTARREAQSPH